MSHYSYDDFLRDHHAALTVMKVPELYWPSVHAKLLGEIFDAPEKFQLGMLNYVNDENKPVDRKLFLSVKVDEVRASDPNKYVDLMNKRLSHHSIFRAALCILASFCATTPGLSNLRVFERLLRPIQFCCPE